MTASTLGAAGAAVLALICFDLLLVLVVAGGGAAQRWKNKYARSGQDQASLRPTPTSCLRYSTYIT
uniref:Uncharacterized protein n=1 Tax=Leersia perrieri TaxID=77586 RepID=A0A0D9WBQ8_9ORYZ